MCVWISLDREKPATATDSTVWDEVGFAVMWGALDSGRRLRISPVSPCLSVLSSHLHHRYIPFRSGKSKGFPDKDDMVGNPKETVRTNKNFGFRIIHSFSYVSEINNWLFVSSVVVLLWIFFEMDEHKHLLSSPEEIQRQKCLHKFFLVFETKSHLVHVKLWISDEQNDVYA